MVDKKLSSFNYRAHLIGFSLLFLYLLIFAGIFAALGETGSFVSSFYFVCVTFALVGYGDVVPQSDGGKLVAALYIVLCLMILSVVISRALEESALAFAHGVARTGGSKTRHKVAVQLIVPLLLLVFNTIVTSLFMGIANDLSFAQSLYAGIVTLASVGYGDVTFSDTGDFAKFLASIWVVFSTFLTSYALTWMVQVITLYFRHRNLKILIRHDQLDEIDRDGDKNVSKDEFVLFQLEKVVDGVTKELISKIEKQYEQQKGHLKELGIVQEEEQEDSVDKV